MVPVSRLPDWKDLYFLQFATVILFLGFVPIGTLVMKKWGYITVFPFASILWWSASVCPGSSDQLEVSPLLEALSCARTEMGLHCLTDRIAAAVVCAMGTPYTVRYPCRDTTNLGIETTARAGAIHSPFSSAGVSLYPTQGSVMR
jgi:hypothetical protein